MHESTAEYLANIVRYNTGNKQPDAIEEHRLRLIAVAHGKLTHEEFAEALETALEMELLVRTNNRLAVPD